jgi:hypothetical protein
MVAWQAIISVLDSRPWDASLTDSDIAGRFAELVWNIDAHLPDGIEQIIKLWFDASGIEKMASSSDPMWNITAQMCLKLALSNVLSPSLLLRGLIYPAWQRARNFSDSDAIVRTNLMRSTTLAAALLCCLPVTDESDQDYLEFLLQAETCRARCFHPTEVKDLVRELFCISTLEQNPSTAQDVRELLETFRTDLLNDKFMQKRALSRVDLLSATFDEVAELLPTHKERLIQSFRIFLRCECTLGVSLG